LAQEGLNPRKLTRALQTFELRPSYEDIFHVETSSVDEYLRQVHEAISVTAVQEAQRGAVAAFEDFMDASMQDTWREDRATLLDSVVPYSASVVPGPSPGGAMSPYTASGGIRGGGGASYRGTSGGPGGRGTLAAAGLQIRGRAAKYAGVVKKILKAQSGGQMLEDAAVSDFAAACAEDGGGLGVAAADGGGGERRTTMLRVWQVLQHILERVGSLPHAAIVPRRETMVAGARGYLQENFVAYMQGVVATHRTQAALGGNPSRLGLLHAFLRVKERERGPFDFDQQPGGLDTTWLRIYTCLRAGYVEEALSVIKGAGSIGGGGGGSTPRAADAAFANYLKSWIEGGQKPLTGEAAAALAAECERLLRDRSARHRAPFHAHKIMSHALLAGAARAADAIMKETPTFFPTIEDFLWFRLGLVRAGAGGASGGALIGLDHHSLQDLQQYLLQYPATHYSHGGREPLLYVVVLLLTMQFSSALGFLASSPLTRDYRLDAVHLAACLHLAGVLEPSPPSSSGSASRGGGGRDGGGGGGGGSSTPQSSVDGGGEGDAASLLKRYAREFVKTDPEMALHYYMLAASAAAAASGGSSGAVTAARGAFLRELLVESKAYGYLLGAGGDGSGGALAEFVPNAAERGAVLEAVARECAAAAQLEEAVELFLYAGRPRQALSIINMRLSEAVEACPVEPAAVGAANALISRGTAAVAAMGPGGGGGGAVDPADLKEKETFQQLRVIMELLMASAQGNHPAALQALEQLAFIPLESGRRLQMCISGATLLHPALADRLPSVVLAGARALAAANKKEQLHTLVTFASSVPARIPTSVYQNLNQLQASVC
jgi:nuclear pore complex protein Nup93